MYSGQVIAESRRNYAGRLSSAVCLLEIFVFTASLCIAQDMSARSKRTAFRLPAAVPAPADNRGTRKRSELGKMLFFDPRLSGSGRLSCASCHNPSLGWADGLPFARGRDMKELTRSTPSITNAAFNEFLMWDGRFRTLEEQALAPIQSASEMDSSLEAAVARLTQIPEYRRAFDQAYPGEGITGNTIAKALACFERTVISRDSAFDNWAAGREDAMSASAKRGFGLFIGKANCVACHQGPNFTDQGFHNTGLAGNRDEGRYARVPIKVAKGAFKTPTLRDVALTSPYMHNGCYKTLAEVVEHYNRGGDDRENLDPNMKPLNLGEQDKKDLVAFMQSLTGRQKIVTAPRLPR